MTMKQARDYRAIMDAFIEAVQSVTDKPGAWIGPYARSKARRVAESKLGPVVPIRWPVGETTGMAK